MWPIKDGGGQVFKQDTPPPNFWESDYEIRSN